MPTGSSSGKGGLRVGEEAVGSHWVACCGSQREKVEQLRLQSEVQDVALAGGKPPTLSGEASAEETDERRWAGGPVDLVREGRESSPNSLDKLGCGLAGPCSGPSCGPSALSCGEAQGLCLVSRVDLGRDPRPIHLKGPLSYKEGVSGEAYGPVRAVTKGEGAFYGDETPISPPRACVVQSPSKIRGASGGASGGADPLVGLPRDSMMLCSSQLMDRGHLTDKALCEEASKYVDLCFIPLGGRDLSSSSPSSFRRVMLNDGSFGGSASMVNEEEQTSLSIILADGSNGVLASKGEKPVVGEGAGGEFEGLLQDLDGCRWDDSCLARFSNFLGFSTEGFEGEILNFLLRTKRRSEQNLKKGSLGTTKFDRELKKLEWSINYNGERKENSVVRESGVRISTVR